MVSVNDTFNVTKSNQLSNGSTNIENILQQSMTTSSTAPSTIMANPFTDSTLAYDSFIMKNSDKTDSMQSKTGSYTEIENQFNMISNPFVGPAKQTDWNQSIELNFSTNHTEFSPNAENYANLRGNIDNELSNAFTSISNNTAKNLKKEIPMDLFKDMAKAAFNEFNNIKSKNNEFYNKISTFDHAYNDTDGMKILLKN